MSDMSKELTKKLAPEDGRSCDIGLATSKHFATKGDYAFITHRRKQKLIHAAYHNNQNITVIQGDIADLDLIYATAGTAEGPLLHKLTISHWIFVGKGDLVFHLKQRRIC